MVRRQSSKILLISIFTLLTLVLLVINTICLIYSIETTNFWGFPEVGKLDNSVVIDTKLKNVRCPVFIRDGEIKTISMAVGNTSDESTFNLLQVVISYPDKPNGFVRREKMVTLDPGESDSFDRTISGRNLIDGQRVLIRFYVGKEIAYLPYLTKACRVVNLSIGSLSSNLSAFLIYGISLMGILVTAVWFTKLEQKETSTPFRPHTIFVFLVSMSVLMSLFTFLNYWAGGFVMGLLIVLGSVAFLESRYGYR